MHEGGSVVGFKPEINPVCSGHALRHYTPSIVLPNCCTATSIEVILNTPYYLY